jgi:UDP-2,4-diacetamido-2,4,6-trideoxy-beta-L-altropyranose hydrolase
MHLSGNSTFHDEFLMKIAFRVDASSQIGTGHFMRCLTLANALQERGAQIFFLSRSLPEYMRNMLAVKGHESVLLKSGLKENSPGDLFHSHWLGTSQYDDAQESIQALSNHSWDWLVVDHYALDVRWESNLRRTVKKIMVIDDLADRKHECDLLLDQNLYREAEKRYKGLLPESCTQLIGPRYALLNPEFAKMRQKVKRTTGNVEQLFVFLGGADIDNVTGQVLEAILSIGCSDLKVDVVVGKANPHRKVIKDYCLHHSNFNYHCNVSNMAELMASADLAIAAGGATTWERCCLGLPSLVVATAENQLEMCIYGADQGLFHYLGKAAQMKAHDYSVVLSTFLSRAENLSVFSRRGYHQVDGRGVERVCSRMNSNEIMMRLARLEDCNAVYAWRNAEETRVFIFDSEPIPFSVHHKWFTRMLADPERLMLIGEVDSHPIGVFFIELKACQGRISLYLVPGLSGIGFGARLLEAGITWTAQKLDSVEELVAEIFPENHESLRVFSRCGFSEHHRELRKKIRMQSGG